MLRMIGRPARSCLRWFGNFMAVNSTNIPLQMLLQDSYAIRDDPEQRAPQAFAEFVPVDGTITVLVEHLAGAFGYARSAIVAP